FSDSVKIETKTQNSIHIKASEGHGISHFKDNKKQFDGEWYYCYLKDINKIYLVVQSQDFSFGSDSVCDHWLPQVFIRNKYNVIVITEPGVGKSNAKNDFGGPFVKKSFSAQLAGFINGYGSVDGKVAGIWAYGQGVIAASNYAKTTKGISRLILGGGVYDLQLLYKTASNIDLKKNLEVLSKEQGEKFFEERSIAWDIEGLPSKINLYHGKNDNIFPSSQSSSFRDALAIGERKVSLQIIENEGHVLTPQIHEQLIEKILKENNEK
ncbi:MAG: hypothetical protein HQK54_03445, partial [Oligoflexales bacterium]|nr:hypothetical protein [Oligoflexales bacterium]